MASYKITSAKRDKGNIYCTTDNGKTIRIDFNNEVIYGVSGKNITSCPAFADFLSDNEPKDIMLQVLARHRYNYTNNKRSAINYTIFRYLDRLANMGLCTEDITNIMSYYGGWYTRSKLNENETYKTIAQIKKEYPNLPFREAKRLYDMKIFSKGVSSELWATLTTQQKETIIELCGNPYCKKYVNYIALWYANEEFDYLNRHIWDYQKTRNFSCLEKYFETCEKLNLQPEKRNPCKHILTTFRAYQDSLNIELDKTIRERQTANKEKFFFEDNNFTMIFPMSTKEFVREGEALNNCLGWNHYNEKVARQDCIVCFIRNKNDIDRPYIACEIRKSNNGHYRISQFLTYNNNRILSEPLIDNYHNALTTYLNTL